MERSQLLTVRRQIQIQNSFIKILMFIDGQSNIYIFNKYSLLRLIIKQKVSILRAINEIVLCHRSILRKLFKKMIKKIRFS